MRNMHVNDLKNRPDLTLSNYINRSKCKKLLGQGAFGIVELYQCETKCNNSLCKRCFIVKTLIADESNNCLGFIKRPDKNRIEHFYKEYEIGILLNHKNIRRTLDLDKSYNSIIFENCRGIDLLDYANDYKNPNTRHLVNYFYQILDAVNYLHNIGVAHLDLKLENIVLDVNTNVIKLIDFGEACFFKDKNGEEYSFKGVRGTVQYLPPEALDLLNFKADKTDVWCCGIILYNLFYNLHPWEIARRSESRYRLHVNTINNNKLNQFIFPEKSEYYTTSEWNIIKYLFLTLLNPNPEKRISIKMTRSIFQLLNISDTDTDNTNSYNTNTITIPKDYIDENDNYNECFYKAYTI